MGYMLPLKFIRVSDQMSICATRIIAIMSTHAYQARRLLKEERAADTLLNAAGRDKVKTAIILDNGTVIASPLSVGQLLRGISTADSKHSKSKKITLNHGLRLYDVMPDEVYDNVVEDYPEMDAITQEDLPEEEEEPELDLDDEDEEGEEDIDALDIAWDGEVSDE